MRTVPPGLPFAFGDLQGCHVPFRRLLDTLSAEYDAPPLWFVGDLVNRGPDSLSTLREVANMGERARVVLGNHDLDSGKRDEEIAFPAAGLSCCCSLSFLLIAGLGLYFALSTAKKSP